MMHCFVKKYFPPVILIFTLPIAVMSEDMPTDDQLQELERQIEQQEAAQQKAKQRAEEDARRKAEAQKLRKERAMLEEERRKMEEERLKQEQDRKQAEQVKKDKEKQQQAEFKKHLVAAKIAVENRDRETAIKQYKKALSLNPDDTIAKAGLQEAQSLKDKLCYDVLGVWLWEGGTAKLTLHEDGTLTYEYWGTHSGIWQCSNPAARQIYVKITALGITQEWNPILSQDNSCLGMKLALVGPECLYRPNANQSDKVKLDSFTPSL